MWMEHVLINMYKCWFGVTDGCLNIKIYKGNEESCKYVNDS